jgi:cytochrome b pre-mRNA-processing protein 3
MGIFSRIFGRSDNAKRDAEVLYRALMRQARNTEFYGEGRFPDNYDGRIDVLTLHVAPVFEALRRFDDNGERLSQAIFDYMKDDFEIALREEGLSDTGVAKRIKPMIRLFYTRVKAYSEAFEGGSVSDVAAALYSGSEETENISLSPQFRERLDTYVAGFRKVLATQALGGIAKTEFKCPPLNPQ